MKILNLLIVSCKYFLAGVSLSLISSFYPTEALNRGVSLSMTGLVIGTAYVLALLATPFCGKYVQKVGARRFLILGSFLIGPGNIFFGFLSDINDTATFLSLSILIRLLIALGYSGLAPAAITFAVKEVSGINQGKVLAGTGAAFAVGTMFGPVIGGYLHDLGGFSLPFFVIGIIMIILSLVSLFYFKESTDNDNLNTEESTSWTRLLNTPGVLVGIFSIVLAGIAKRWYSGSLGPFLRDTYNLSSSQIGLVFLSFGLVYSICVPLVGILIHRGVDCLVTILIGNILIAVSFIFIGPIPSLVPLLGQHLGPTVATIGLQGAGSGFAYIGSFLYINRQVTISELPKSDQTNAMVSSLWLTSECLGCLIGSTLGSFSSDILDFETGTMILSCCMCGSVILVVISLLRFQLMKRNRTEDYEALDTDSTKEPLLSKQVEHYESLNC